jgi:hypothetical protein
MRKGEGATNGISEENHRVDLAMLRSYSINASKLHLSLWQYLQLKIENVFQVGQTPGL